MGKGDSPTQTQSSRTLLLVDDERSLRFSLGEWARDAGFHPLEATNSSEALERVRDHEVDAVLLDLKLADEDGIDVLRRLRELDPALPVVMLTGHGTVEHAVRATRLSNNCRPSCHCSKKAGDSSIHATTMYAMTQSATSRRTELKFQCQKYTGTFQMAHQRPTSSSTPAPASE